MTEPESTPIKIVLLLQDLEFGGTQRYALHLLKHLDRRNFSPEIWVLRGGPEMIPAARHYEGDIVRMSPSPHVGLYSLFRLALHLIRHRPCILYTLTVVPNIWGRIFGRLVKVPVIVSGYRSLVPKQHERRLWPLSRRIICNARILKEIMIHIFNVEPARIAVIPNGVDTDFFSPDSRRKDREPSFLYIGRLVKDKDPFNLLEAFRIVLKRYPRAHLTLIGSGPLKRKIEQKISSLSLQAKVSCLPGTPDILPYLRRAWVFILPSCREASPNAVLEAMAAGLPVVATRVGGVREVIEDGRTGLLVRPRSPRGLAEGMIYLLENREKRQAMGAKARGRVLSAHSLEDMTRKTEQVFLEALTEAEPHHKAVDKKGRC